MTIFYSDACGDYLLAADTLNKYTIIYSDSVPAITTGRVSGNAYLFNTPGNQSILQTLPSVSTTTPVYGIAFKVNAFSNPVSIVVATEGSLQHITLATNTNSGFSVYRGSVSGTLLGSSTNGILAANTWYYVEMGCTISDTVGTVEVRLNGNSASPVINLTSQDTKNGSTGLIDGFKIADEAGGSSDNFTVDDFYFADTFLGDIKVESSLANGNGNYSDLIGSDANSVNNYLLIDEATPNDDTDYVEGLTTGNKDTYTFTDLATTAGTVYGVQIVAYARKTDAGTRNFQTVARLSGTNTNSSSKALTNNYRYYHDMRETKPGGGAWTITDYNNAEFGIEIA